MSRWICALATAALLWGSCCTAQKNGTAFLEPFSHISPCAQQCLVSAIPASSCLTFTNATCICTNEALTSAARACILDTCNVTDALAVARAQADACEYPVRNMRGRLLAPLSIEMLGLVAVLLRLYSRWVNFRRYEADDWIMVVCTPIFIVFEVVGHVSGQMGFGVDLYQVDPETFTEALKLFYVDEPFYQAVISLTKLAMLFCYLRIFPQRTFRYFCYATITWVALSGAMYIVLFIAQCRPIPYVWEGWLGGFGPHQCMNLHALAYASGFFSIAQDVVILALPMPMLRGLNAGFRSKVEVGVMFSLGFFILLTSCVRLGLIVRFGETANPSWDWSEALIWSGIEAGVSMIITSLPAMRYLLRTSSDAPKPRRGPRTRDSKNRRGPSRSISKWSTFSTSLSTTLSTKATTRLPSDGDVEMDDRS